MACKCETGREKTLGIGAEIDWSISITVYCAEGRSESTYTDFFVHEFVHAVDDCIRSKKGAKRDCNFIACTEIRAYAFANCSEHADPKLREECIKDGATNSVRIQGSCGRNDRDARAAVDRNYAVCGPSSEVVN